jgi:hypothetical protein
MWRVDYYTKSNGRQPAKDWIESQDNSIRPSIDARIDMLKREGPQLPETMLVLITPRGKGEKFIPGFYELKHRGKKWRIATYHDRGKNKFVLLCGWRKSQDIQEWDIDKARKLLDEYKLTEGG